MHTLVEVLVTLLVGAGGIVGGGTALVVRRLHRANRLVLHLASPAPTRWLWSWKRAAVLHRRLHNVCELAQQTSGATPGRARRRFGAGRDGAPTSPLARVGQELIDHALSLDGRLVAADRLGGSWRRPAVANLEVEVRRLELSAERLVGLSAAWQHHLLSVSAPVALRPPDLTEQLDAVEAALDELEAPRH